MFLDRSSPIRGGAADICVCVCTHTHTHIGKRGPVNGISPNFRVGVHLFVWTAIRHRVSPEFIGSCNCVPMESTAESPPAQG